MSLPTVTLRQIGKNRSYTFDVLGPGLLAYWDTYDLFRRFPEPTLEHVWKSQNEQGCSKHRFRALHLANSFAETLTSKLT